MPMEFRVISGGPIRRRLLKSRAVFLPSRLHGVRRVSAFVTVAVSLLPFSCQPQGKNKPQESQQKATSGPSQTDNWERMKECAAQTDSLAGREGWVRGDTKSHVTTEDWSNHYSPKYERCYVEVSYRNHLAEKDKDLPLLYFELWDAFEGKLVASCTNASTAGASIVCESESKFGDCRACRQFVKDRMNN